MFWPDKVPVRSISSTWCENWVYPGAAFTADFTDRNEFIHALLDYWHEIHTVPVPDRIMSIDGTAREKFLKFLQYIHEYELTRFDIPIRSWAMQEPEVAKRLLRTDRRATTAAELEEMCCFFFDSP